MIVNLSTFCQIFFLELHDFMYSRFAGKILEHYPRVRTYLEAQSGAA